MWAEKGYFLDPLNLNWLIPAEGKYKYFSLRHSSLSYGSVLFLLLKKEGMIINIKKLSVSAFFIALGTLTSHLIYIPVGVSRCFPVQHLINVLSAVLLGPGYAVWNAFAISVLRNIMGVGSLLAFPGSMIGALLAGLIYRQTKGQLKAVIGEVIGTGIIGGLAAYPVARYLIGSEVAVLFFVIPFLMSTLGGSIIAYLILKKLLKNELLKKWGLN
jgi:energy coupling factor transporter S component ThiW